MGNDHEGDIKQYIHVSEAWYADTSLASNDYEDEVTFGFYSPDGGTSGEMGMRWYQLCHDKGLTPRLEVFGDAWHALSCLNIIDALADLDETDITPKQFCELLDRCGFVDDTPRTRPTR